MRTVHVVMPAGVDDPRRPSGGNVYDRRLCEGLRALGWEVFKHEVEGRWPYADSVAWRALGDRLSQVPDHSLVLVDGLVGSASPGPLAREAHRLRLLALVHCPLGALGEAAPNRDARDSDVAVQERGALQAATAVLATSRWTRSWLASAYRLAPDRIFVAEPGVDAVPVTGSRAAGDRLLCVGAVTRAKGQDVLAAALGSLADLCWQCTWVGSLDLEPELVGAVRQQLRSAGVADRVVLRGPVLPAVVGEAYAAADLLVLPSRVESYGMVVTEALARGIPVVASDVGGVGEALGVRDGPPPGCLVPPEEPAALADALRRWLTDPGRRTELRRAAARRRPRLRGWDDTARSVSGFLAAVREPSVRLGR